MTQDEKIAIEVRARIAKAVFDDKVSTRDIDAVEHKIIAEALQKARAKERERCAVLASELPAINTYQQDIQWEMAQAIRNLK